MSGTLTGANSIITLSIETIFPTPIQLQGFAADDVADTQSIQSAETLMGVDGILSGGFVFAEVKQSITLQADSGSMNIFDQWFLAQQANLDTYVATGVLILPSLGTKWTYSRGFLTGYTPVPPIKKLAQPRKFEITWNSIKPSPS